jgi:glycosyltransferase involved in cell wall biosynthesis
LVSFIKLERIDVVHTHFSPTCHFGNLAAWLAGVPGRFWHLRSMSGIDYGAPSSLGHIAAQRISCRLVSRIFSVSNAIREDFARLGLPREKITVLPCGVNLERFCASDVRGAKARIRASLRLPESTLLVGTVSRAEPIKGLSVLVEAAARVAAVHSNIRWLVVGGGSQMPQLQSLARTLGVDNQIIFEGIREDIPDLLQAMDIFVLPSLSEGLPTAAMEAMASGRPVVCSRVGGLAELVTHGESGLLFLPGDSVALAEGVLQLVADRGLRERLSTAAIVQAAKYDDRVLCNRLLDLYERTVPVPLVRGQDEIRSHD